MNDLSYDNDSLLTRVQQVLDYYKSSDVESIMATINSVESTLNDTMVTLKMVSVDAEILSMIDYKLQEVIDCS